MLPDITLQKAVMLRLNRFRWLVALAIVAVLAIGIAVWRVAGDAGRLESRLDLLRAAFDRASAQCYEAYRGPELQACLAGVMKAHLHALGGGTEETEPESESGSKADSEVDSGLARARSPRL